MGTTLNVKLSTSSISKAIDEVNAYRESLIEKGRIFRDRLADIGIETAREHCGEYSNFIVFEKRDEGENTTYIIATDGQKIVKEWFPSKKDAAQGTNKRSYEISPLLMAEFGSGWLAIEGWQGSMPWGYGHAYDKNGWYWYDASGTKHRSRGESPTLPMYYAFQAMMNDIDRIAKEVFQTNRVVKC